MNQGIILQKKNRISDLLSTIANLSTESFKWETLIKSGSGFSADFG